MVEARDPSRLSLTHHTLTVAPQSHRALCPFPNVQCVSIESAASPPPLQHGLLISFLLWPTESRRRGLL
jgi:hypothetical protein